MDGDRLRGFNEIGFDLGIQGIYMFNEQSEFLVSQSFSSFGSNASNGSLKFMNDYYIDISMTTANLLMAYTHNIGSGWSGEAKARVTGGFKLHQIMSSDWQLTYNVFHSEPPVSIDKFKERFVSMTLGAGYLLGSNLFLDLTFDMTLTNVLDHSDIENQSKSLNPYYFMLGLSYYL